MISPDWPSLFISYARRDDEPFVERLRDDLIVNGFKVWWDRAAMESRGRTFLQEIRDAIEGSERVIAVIGPQALKSDYVRMEWEHALLFCKAIVPVLRIGDYDAIPTELCVGDYWSMPVNLRKFHIPDFRAERPYEEALQELLHLLATPVAPFAPFLTEVPSLPPHFLPRRVELADLAKSVLADIHRPMVITSATQTTALQGMGGVGKSVLAAAFARAADTRRACGDGIVWLTVGVESDPLRNLRQVGLAFGDAPEHYVGLEDARDRLPRVLADKVCLIVMDDVWDVADVIPLRNAIGARCRLLFTTRDASLVTALGAQEHRLEVLDDDAALRLLADWSEQSVDALPPKARIMAKECGNLPFALALCGAMVRDGILWTDLIEALGEADLGFMKRRFPDYPYPDVLRSFKVSLDMLERTDPDAAECYRELVVFPADVAVPEAAVMTLWLHGRDQKERTVRKWLATLERKALLRLEGEASARRVSLHDLQHDYLRAIQDNLPALHDRLLSAYAARCPNGWPSGPDDSYFFQHLAYHLAQAERKEELRGLLLDFDWLLGKLKATDINVLIADYAFRPDDPEALLIQGALHLAAPVLARDRAQLPGQLLGRLLSFTSPGIQGLVEQTAKWRKVPWLRPLVPRLTPPGGRLFRTLVGHEDKVFVVATTPDSRRIVSGSLDRTLKVWDLATGELLCTLHGHSRRVTAVTVTPDGRYAISASADKTLKIWDLEKGALLRTLSHDDWVMAVAVTPDGKRIISGAKDRTLKVWDFATGEKLQTLVGHDDEVSALAITSDGSRVVSGSVDKTLKIWMWRQDKLEFLHTLQGHHKTVTAVAMTPNGRHAVSASLDETIKVWNLEDGIVERTLSGHRQWVLAVAVTPDGQRIVSGAHDGGIATDLDNLLEVWNLASGEELYSLHGHTASVQGVAMTPNGEYAISASCDHTLKIWRLEADDLLILPRDHTERVNDIVVTPNGRLAVSASNDHTLKVWDAETRMELHALKGHTQPIWSVAIVDDGRAVSASLDGTLRVWDLQSGAEIDTLRGHKDRVLNVTTDGRYALSASDDYTVRVWDLASGKLIYTLDHPNRVHRVAVTPNGQYVVSASEDDTLRMWDLGNGQVLHTLSGHDQWINDIAVTPDNRWVLSASFDHTVKVWDLVSGKEVMTLAGYTGPVGRIIVTPDGQRAVSAGGMKLDVTDATMRVWDLANGKPLRVLSGHTDAVYGIAVTQDGRRVVSASGDHTLRVWNLNSGDEIASFFAENPLNTCAITPDGRTVFAGDEFGRVHILKLETSSGMPIEDGEYKDAKEEFP